MAPELQTKLLRFTQDRMLSPIGGTPSDQDKEREMILQALRSAIFARVCA